MRTARLHLSVLLLAVLTIMAASCATAKGADSRQGYTVHASFAKGYGDLHSLKVGADLVVVGRVGSLLRTTSTPSRAGAPTAGLIFSDYAFQVQQVLSGTLSGATITVHQTGGTANGRTLELDNDPLLQVGQEDILFLHHDPATNTYYVIGGPQGRFVVINGLVSSLARAYPKQHIQDSVDINQEPLADFVNAIRSA